MNAPLHGPLAWLPRDDEPKDHGVFSSEHFGTEAPCVMYELKPVLDKKYWAVEGLFTAWITLNNPGQGNSYTTEMVKGVIAGFQIASADRSVVAVVFTAMGEKFFCTGGNTKEYAEYYSRRPEEYGAYMDLFIAMVDAILNCKKPTICRVNGSRIAGGQEIGMACDFTVAGDHAIFGQAGPKHGSAPDGGSTDFLPAMLSAEDAMWQCVSCEMWSAYKMKLKGLITQVIPVLTIGRGGGFVRNPFVITDQYIVDGEIVYGEMKIGDDLDAAKTERKMLGVDFTTLDLAINQMVWRFTNLFPGCLIKAIDGIRAKKKFFWDQSKLPNRHWLAANMSVEAFLGFSAYSTKKQTGRDTIDFVRFRQLIAEGAVMDEAAFAECFPSRETTRIVDST
ncbi:6-oxocyclohex-1-ene-1-carbonyl-CoA hydratase [Patescibacteria group bacterium]|nr:6-oxocyclohex-1-ene-1-carbonyl-CoA hydratase [Patescibacteria group bacterium]MBU1074902.1 6-oxocyclohex-1-ene-1-carbonyl-CoA hydratase [Patescibacteria group bacterium]MBU1952064.1 6-oxocyclohex-1-ene-1-carbonyl-CoA hydratase [Patescibacteria group bacterium]MBU2235900.1 6-oxocyclohex-1-ene-1-carbonyl-CoA hydratase [Patescibacteria group bacterium]